MLLLLAVLLETLNSSINIALLTIFGAAANQKNDLIADLTVIDSPSCAKVDTQFKNTLAH